MSGERRLASALEATEALHSALAARDPRFLEHVETRAMAIRELSVHLEGLSAEELARIKQSGDACLREATRMRGEALAELARLTRHQSWLRKLGGRRAAYQATLDVKA